MIRLIYYPRNFSFKKLLILASISAIIYPFQETYAACPPAGTGIVANGTTETETGCTITTVAINTPGALADNGGIINLSNSSISTTGANSPGAEALNGGQLNFNNVSISTTGVGSVGVHVSDLGTEAELIDGSIMVNNANPTGVLSENGALLQLQNVAINVTSSGGSGAGAIADLDGFLVFTNGSSITTQGNGVDGAVFSNQGSGNIFNTTISTSGDNSRGILLTSDGTALLSNVGISTTGSGAYGFQADSGTSAIISTSTIQTSGTSAHSMLLSDTFIDILGSTVSATGVDASAVFTQGPGSVLFTATNTQFSAVDAPIFVFDSGDADVSFTTVTANATAPNLFMVVSPTVNLTLVADDSELSGDMQISSTSNTNMTFNNGTTYAGAIGGSTANLTIDGTSSWNITGSSTLGTLTHAGSIVFAPPAPDYKTLTTTDYIGQDGSITFNTFLAGSSSPTDQLIIDSGSATGSTNVFINNTGGLGALTLGNGILLVNAINGATTTTNAFSMTPIEVGIFRYSLFRGGSGAGEADNWYLRSLALVPASVGPTVIPAPVGMSFVPAFREFVSLHSTIPSLALLFNRMILSDGLHQRVGEEEQLLGRLDLGERSNFNGFWVRVLGQNGDISNGNIFHDGPDFDYNFAAIQPGVDIYHSESAYGQEFIGAFAVLGRGHSNVDHFMGVAGNNNMRGYAGALYWTHFDNAGWYLDGVIDATFTPINSDPVGAPSADTNGKGVGLSLESGYPFKLGNAYTIEPEAQIIAGSVGVNNMNNVVPIDFANSRSIAARLGTRLTKTWSWQRDKNDIIHLLTGWLFANTWREFDGISKTSFNTGMENFSFDSNLRGDWAEFGLGLSGEIAKNTSIYASGERQTSLSGGNLSGYAGSVGVRINL